MSKLNLNKTFDRGDDCSSTQIEKEIIEKQCTQNTPRKIIGSIPSIYVQTITYCN